MRYNLSNEKFYSQRARTLLLDFLCIMFTDDLQSWDKYYFVAVYVNWINLDLSRTIIFKRMLPIILVILIIKPLYLYSY